MLEWTEISLVDDLKLRLVASNWGLCGLQFQPFSAVDGVRNDANALLRETEDADIQLPGYHVTAHASFDDYKLITDEGSDALPAR